ncbi:MAG: hypothetical protein IJS96_03815 [Schwartzia sp.]|nr:hypothetical protein [Schwartzia sp. (in: firmicutes)]
MNTRDIIPSGQGYTASHIEKMRRYPEVLARYKKELEDYKRLMQADVDPREQRVMLYSELKVLGWVLGKSDQQISLDISS